MLSLFCLVKAFDIQKAKCFSIAVFIKQFDVEARWRCVLRLSISIERATPANLWFSFTLFQSQSLKCLLFWESLN